MDGLISHLQRTHGISRERAQKRAEWLVRQTAERAAAKKVRLSTAQTLLPLDGQPGEEPTNKFESDESVPF